MNSLINLSAFALLTILWLGFGAALVFDRALLDSSWQSFRGLPLVPQVIVGLLVLPVVIGLWIWETDWPFWVRIVLVAGLAVATLYTFFPRSPKA
jgi:hypothetical protein